jgi:tRNA(fMet)-specific endonuclease VapC
MLYLLDTDTASYAIRGASATLDAALAAAVSGSLAISAITRAELMFGLEKRGDPRALKRLVQSFMVRVAVMPWDTAAADRYAILRAQLERGGTPIGQFDTMIAAHALALGAVLVTNNRRHFQQVKALMLENWYA